MKKKKVVVVCATPIQTSLKLGLADLQAKESPSATQSTPSQLMASAKPVTQG